MSSLFDINKPSLKKIFSAHEKDSVLKFTDLLKLCSSTRIFPDLLTSPELHKILIEVAQDPQTHSISQSLTYPQFEIFLREVAQKAFSMKSEPEKESLLFLHLKNSCELRYCTNFEVKSAEKRNLLTKTVPRLNIESTNVNKNVPKTVRKILHKPNSTKNVKSSSFLFRNSPKKASVEKKYHKNHAFSIITPRIISSDKLSTKASPRMLLTERIQQKIIKSIDLIKKNKTKNKENTKIKQICHVLDKFKSKKNIKHQVEQIKNAKFLRFIQYFNQQQCLKKSQKRIAFKLWSIVTKKQSSKKNTASHN